MSATVNGWDLVIAETERAIAGTRGRVCALQVGLMMFKLWKEAGTYPEMEALLRKELSALDDGRRTEKS